MLVFWLNTEDNGKIERASMCKVLSVDKEKQSGQINDYCVTLENCTCRDFLIHKQPCKHMFRLAHELGLISLTIKAPALSKDDAIKLVTQELTNTERELLYHLLYWCLYRGKCYVISKGNQNITNLLKHSLITEGFHLDSFAEQINKKYLVETITSYSLPIKKNIKKIDMLRFIADKHPDVLNKIKNDFYIVVPSKQFMPRARIIYNLLCKEFRVNDTIFE